MQKELTQLGIGGVDAIFSTTHTADYLLVLPELLRPFGHLAVIDPAVAVILPFKGKALSVHWEFMFAKSMFGYQPQTQGEVLRQVADLVDAGKVKTARRQTLVASEENVCAAHEALERGSAIWGILLDRIEHPSEASVKEVRIIEPGRPRCGHRQSEGRNTLHDPGAPARVRQRHPARRPALRQSPVVPVHLSMVLDWTPKTEEADQKILQTTPAEVQQEVESIIT